MKLLIDECLSPGYVQELSLHGYPDAVHPINIGLCGARDDQILSRAFAEDRVVITANGRDYKRLLARMPLHPGAIIVEALEREPTLQLLLVALAFIELQPRPADYMVNRVIEVSASHGVRPYELPAAEAT